MKNPKVLYILISVFCVFAILAGIYAQFIDADYGGLDLAAEDANKIEQEKSQVEIKDEFDQLFTNNISLNGFDTTGISKLNAEKDIVYTIYEKLEINDNYEVDIHIPIINIKSDVANRLNQNTQTIFVNKANEILQNIEPSKKSIYSIDYTAYVNGNILSIAIMSTLKESSASQRIIVQTYNYNLSTNSEVSLIDLLTIKQLNRDEVNAKIMEVVKQADEEDKALQSMGYNQVYMRDLNSDIYKVENAGGYFLGPDNTLYIVYAYGNGEFTSKMDIIVFE